MNGDLIAIFVGLIFLWHLYFNVYMGYRRSLFLFNLYKIREKLLSYQKSEGFESTAPEFSFAVFYVDYYMENPVRASLPYFIMMIRYFKKNPISERLANEIEIKRELSDRQCDAIEKIRSEAAKEISRQVVWTSPFLTVLITFFGFSVSRLTRFFGKRFSIAAKIIRRLPLLTIKADHNHGPRMAV